MNGLSELEVWFVVIGVAVVTYALRASFVLGIDYLGEFPPTVDRVIPFFPIAILSALVVPNLFLIDGAVTIGSHNPELVAGLVAFAAAWYSDNMLVTVSVGMLTLWGLVWLGFG